jgi:hypothetical protein
MAFVSRDLMVNVLYQMAGEGEGDRPDCTPSPTTTPDEYGDGCTPSPPNPDEYGDGCTPSPPPRGDDYGCTPSPPDCTPSPDDGCTPSPPPTHKDDDEAPLKALASLRQQLRETLAQA